MSLEFRRRDYRAEKQVHSLPRSRADIHPLSASPSTPVQVEQSNGEKDIFFDPLRAKDEETEVSENINSHATFSGGSIAQSRAKEWSSFTKILMQRFPVSKTVQLSMVSGVFLKGNKAYNKSSRDMQLWDLEDHETAEEDVRVISQQEYVTKLRDLKEEIRQAWCADDRVTSLRLSVKVAKLLMDTSAIQFYPTIFVLATDIMDMLGDLVWNRIKQKAELSENGVSTCSLPDHFVAADIFSDAKETCNNWFSKISSIRELLPRIYLELAILCCWRFLLDSHEDILHRLVLMIRGIADPLAYAYCCLYMAQCVQRLPQLHKSYLVHCIKDLQVIILRTISTGEVMRGNLSVDSKFLFIMIEPAIEFIMKCLFKEVKQDGIEIGNMLVALGMGRSPSVLFQDCSCISIILQHILKELPIGFTCSNAVEILNLIVRTNDCSFDQCLNFKLLGIRLCERIPEVNRVHSLVDIIIKVLSSFDKLGAFVMIVDAYLDIILENQLDTSLSDILDGIYERVQEVNIGENELGALQSIFLKLITHFCNIENILALNHFVDILDMLHGSSRISISLQVLIMATRNGPIRDPTIMEVLFEVAQTLYDGVDFSNTRKDDYQHPGRVITHFLFMVDYGEEYESHLRFLTQCRGAFASISELQEMLVHSSNNLAVKATRDGNSNINFVKSCLAFNEVTIPSVPSNLQQLNLYLEAVEIALLGGFVSHTHGLIDAAVNCLQNIDSDYGSWMPEDANWIISLICKLCGILVMVPGSLDKDAAYVPKRILSFLDSQSWMLPNMKIRVLSAVVSLSTTLAQNQLPYLSISREVIGNDQLFFGVPSYLQELLSLSGGILEGIVDSVLQEPAVAVRGKSALEVCNCIASVFTISDETLEACSKLVEIARSCLSRDDKFLHSTLIYLDAHQFVVLDGRPETGA